MTEQVEIMDIPFINKTKEELLNEDLYRNIDSGKKQFIVTANPEIVMLTKANKRYKDAVLSADYIVADGIGVVLASKRLKQSLSERIPGYELMLSLVEYAEAMELSCYFLGANAEVNQRVVSKIKQRYPKLIVAGHHHGFFELNDETICEKIKQSNPDFIFVALGMPKQEQWIAQYINRFDKGTFMGVGGSFDVVAGEVKRAPNVWIKFNLEWLYRLIKQPQRWKRIIKVFEFLLRILINKY
ncbi:WecB/TagA/CpsF family glycosyltransferase [Amphibacillus cookii]|uniref:WecB/TagA/CpsF family glycosyltransferase n=1 Tax=Amphibacillus cookii TaxID=767787 RepID=UPI0019598292|nr:WecB/TagA/CpsF family glycosyltransferase [Amphibacillus cookii]MBM7543079.1 N-acetylglucosaminyldiphosphoundecaprenol N-acetyl-beta-D-mannosaminyltransferase [Amphibacillus cookii]